jgi:hypothetical protein
MSTSYNQFGIATYDEIRTQIDSQLNFSPWRSIINGLSLLIILKHIRISEAKVVIQIYKI